MPKVAYSEEDRARIRAALISAGLGLIGCAILYLLCRAIGKVVG